MTNSSEDLGARKGYNITDAKDDGSS